MTRNPYSPPTARVDDLVTEPEVLEYVGFWLRVLASMIDTVLLVVCTFPLLIAIYGWDYFDENNTDFFQGPADVFISWVFPAVAVICFWLAKQATPGKMLIKAKIVDATTGRPMTPLQSIGRYMAYFVAAFPLGLGLFWLIFDSKKQGWHDMLAGTVVVRSR